MVNHHPSSKSSP